MNVKQEIYVKVDMVFVNIVPNKMRGETGTMMLVSAGYNKDDQINL